MSNNQKSAMQFAIEFQAEADRLRTLNADLLAALETIDITLSTRRKGKAMEALSIARAAIASAKETG